MTSSLSRRKFLTSAGALASGTILTSSIPGVAQAGWTGYAPMVGPSEGERPRLPSGIQFGDVVDGRAIVWGRSDRNARMIVEYDTTDRFHNARRITGPYASEETDYTTR